MLRRIIGMCLMFMVMGTPGFAQDESLSPVTPPTALESGKIKRYVTYNGDVAGAGTILAIYDNRIVLDDVGVQFSPDITFYTYNGTLTFRDYFKVGMAAGYYLDETGERIISLWEAKTE